MLNKITGNIIALNITKNIQFNSRILTISSKYLQNKTEQLYAKCNVDNIPKINSLFKCYHIVNKVFGTTFWSYYVRIWF